MGRNLAPVSPSLYLAGWLASAGHYLQFSTHATNVENWYHYHRPPSNTNTNVQWSTAIITGIGKPERAIKQSIPTMPELLRQVITNNNNVTRTLQASCWACW